MHRWSFVAAMAAGLSVWLLVPETVELGAQGLTWVAVTCACAAVVAYLTGRTVRRILGPRWAVLALVLAATTLALVGDQHKHQIVDTAGTGTVSLLVPCTAAYGMPSSEIIDTARREWGLTGQPHPRCFQTPTYPRTDEGWVIARPRTVPVLVNRTSPSTVLHPAKLSYWAATAGVAGALLTSLIEVLAGRKRRRQPPAPLPPAPAFAGHDPERGTGPLVAREAAPQEPGPAPATAVSALRSRVARAAGPVVVAITYAAIFRVWNPENGDIAGSVTLTAILVGATAGAVVAAVDRVRIKAGRWKAALVALALLIEPFMVMNLISGPPTAAAAVAVGMVCGSMVFLLALLCLGAMTVASSVRSILQARREAPDTAVTDRWASGISGLAVLMVGADTPHRAGFRTVWFADLGTVTGGRAKLTMAGGHLRAALSIRMSDHIDALRERAAALLSGTRAVIVAALLAAVGMGVEQAVTAEGFTVRVVGAVLSAALVAGALVGLGQQVARMRGREQGDHTG